MNDEQNPNYMFSLTATTLLTSIAKGEIDPVYFAKQELANRGLNLDGAWVGFGKAKDIHFGPECPDCGERFIGTECPHCGAIL